MTTHTYKTLFVAFAFIFLPVSANAATFLPVSDETASLRSEVTGDVYAVNESVVITAPVTGDIFAAGESVDISGSSSASIFAVGQNLTISGEAKDDVRVAGSVVSISSNIAHDLFAAGSNVLITKDSHVHGDAYVAGENVTVSGTIHGNLFVAGTTITLTNGAVVMGNITARGSTPIINEGATVSGTVKTLAPKEINKKEANRFNFGAFITSLISAIIFALTLHFGAPILVARSKENIISNPLRSGFTGLIWLLVFMPVTLLLIVSGIGIYIGLFVLTVTLPLLLLAFGIMILATGNITYRNIAKKDGTPWHYAVIGAVVLSLVSLLNGVGFILTMLAFLVALGALLKSLWNIINGN